MPVKFYLHIGGNTRNAKGVLSQKSTTYAFVKSVDDQDKDIQNNIAQGQWILKVGSKIRARVSTNLQLKMFGDQRRIDFVSKRVRALKFPKDQYIYCKKSVSDLLDFISLDNDSKDSQSKQRLPKIVPVTNNNDQEHEDAGIVGDGNFVEITKDVATTGKVKIE